MLRRVVVFAAILGVPAVASAGTISIDNFESGNLNAWTACCGQDSGQIVADPLNASNHVLNFTALGAGGDEWTVDTYAGSGSDWWLSFDYLGMPLPGGLSSGGSIGWDDDTSYAGNERWLASTAPNAADSLLTDDGAWHHYLIHLTAANLPNPRVPVHIKLEDWYGADQIAGNAYFDNFSITDVNPEATVPEPGTLTLLALGCGMLAGRRRGSR